MSAKYLSYVKNLSTYFGASLLPMALSLLANPWIAKNMSPEDYAISGYYTSFTSLISPIIAFYMIHYYIKEYFQRSDEERQRLFSLIAKALIWFSGIVSAVCFLLLLFYIKFLRGNSDLPVSPYLALSVFALPLTGLLNLRLAQLKMQKKAHAYFVYAAGNGVLNVVLTVVLVVLLRMGATGKLLAPFLCNAAVFLYILWSFRDIMRTRSTMKEFKTVFIFCLPLTLSAMLGYFNNGFSTTYLESVGDNTEYGIYIVGASIGTYLMVFATAAYNTFQPDLYESTIKKQRKRYLKICALMTGIVGATALLFVLLAPFVVSILTAGRYVASVPYAQIISLASVTSTVYFIINDFAIATDRPKLYLYTSIIGSIGMVVFVPVFVDRWQYTGGAWMSVLSYVMMTVIYAVLLTLCHYNIIPRNRQ